ncbi:MAG TPA: single-stranded-DNA-specific exonuclease RecJ [Burkholderiaceae bacterium]|nr:single-stranded-DNA-specific exonuclease RecJ [Burkholderiaceae bacterium]
MTRFVQRDFDPRVAAALAASGLPRPLARAMAARGVRSAQELVATPLSLVEPAQLTQAQRAAVLLADAIGAGERLLVVADYDCDGATACAVALRGLRMMGAQVDYLVPNRQVHGYGLTPAIVELAAARRPHWLVTVDNGIASVEGVARANELGLRVLVTDHHLPGDRLPEAACIVNPNQPGCGFPSKHLAGVGVMFYVLLALRAELRARGAFEAASQPRLDALLDLVALGTVADVVRLDRNNRLLVGLGLARVRAGRMQPGLAALFAVAGRDARSAHAADFGFALGPRINAAGRLTDMTVGIECLSTDDPGRAQDLARTLDQLNRERRDIEGDMQLDAQALLEGVEVESRRTITLFDESWHPGVVGLVASRVKERHHRPTVAFARGEDGLRGSGRSIEGVHLRDTLDLVSKMEPELIERFGGHAMAAGLTLRPERYEGFARAFEQATVASTEAALFARTVAVDGPLAAEEITLALLADTEAQIWGQGFPAPLYLNEFRVLEQRLLKDAHLKLALELDGRRFDAIWFRRTEPLPPRAVLAYRPTSNDWNGTRRVQLMIEHAEG